MNKKLTLHRGLFRALLFGMAVLLSIVPVGKSDAEPATITVFAAASTTNVITDICQLYDNGGTEKAVPSFASSSTLAKQIGNGAPADVYISANEKWMDYLEEKGCIDSSTRFDLLGNRIVLIAPLDSDIDKVEIVSGFDLAGLLGKDGRLAMGDPDHVPAGLYGKAALKSLGVWQSVEKSVAGASSVRAALALVERGEVPVGLVYATDAAISEKVKVIGVFPQESHPPISYPVAIISGRKTPKTDRFVSLLKSDDAKKVFESAGFTVK